MSCSSAGSDAPCDAAPCSVRRSSSSCSPVCESCRRRWLSQRAAETPLSPANKRLTARKRHIRRRPTMTIGCPGLILTVCSRGRPTYSRYLLTTPPPSPRLRDARRVLVPREAGRPRRTLVWLSTDRPHQPAAVTFEDVLTGMANHQLATITQPVDLAAPVPVYEIGERVTRGRLLSHASWWRAGVTTVGGRPASAWEG
jgi:hypothetical protein